MKRKRKLPLALFSALVVLVGGAFMANAMWQRTNQDPSQAPQEKDPNKAVGNETAASLDTNTMKENVAGLLSAQPKKKKLNKMQGMEDRDTTTGPLILNPQEQADNARRTWKPATAPDSGAVGQWYTKDSGIKK